MREAPRRSATLRRRRVLTALPSPFSLSDGADVGGMRRRRAFALLSCGTVLFVAAYLLLQEAAIRRAKADGAPLSPAWLTLVNEGAYALLAACECALVGAGPRGDKRARGARLPKWRGAYGVLALVVFSAMWCTNASLAHVDFATRLVAKSAKVVPVMAISRALLGKRYSPAEYAAALVLAAGVALFSLGDAMVNPEWHITGMALLAAAVTLDALTSTIAERYVFKVGKRAPAACTRTHARVANTRTYACTRTHAPTQQHTSAAADHGRRRRRLPSSPRRARRRTRR